MKVLNHTFDRTVTLGALLLVIFAALNPYRLYPSADLFPNILAGLVVLIATSMAFFTTDQQLKLNKSTMTWVLLFAVILIQPVINNIAYIDSLINPLASLVCVLLFSIAVMSVNNKHHLLQQFEIALIVCLSLSFGIQLLQLYGYNLSISSLLLTSLGSGRLDANFAQPNQAAFMFCLAQVGCLYWYELNKHKLWLLVFGVFSIGIALTLSRTGFILGFANILLFYGFLNQTLKQRLFSIIKLSAIYAALYGIGVWLYKSAQTPAMSNAIPQDNAIARFSEGSLYMRESLQEQAYLIFVDQPWTGIGWGNFVQGAMSHYDQLRWFAYSEHSHFFVTQIASELGVLGLLTLIPLGLFIIKKISFTMSSFEATCYTSIAIFILYSCSEFPLWYFKYLLIFVFFIALLDEKYWSISMSVKKVITSLSIILMLGSMIYLKDFIKIHKIFSEVKNVELSEQALKNRYIAIPKTFGLLKFKEQFLFYYLPVNVQSIDYKIELAKRVVPSDLNQSSLFKYGQLLALNKNTEMANIIFKAACALEMKNGCIKITDRLKQLSLQDSEIYTEYYDEVTRWVKTKKINSTS